MCGFSDMQMQLQSSQAFHLLFFELQTCWFVGLMNYPQQGLLHLSASIFGQIKFIAQ